MSSSATPSLGVGQPQSSHSRSREIDRALVAAVESNNAREVFALLERDASPNASTSTLEGSVLHAAAARGFDAVARLLLLHSASSDSHDTRGRSPLHVACMNGHLATARLLLDRYPSSIDRPTGHGLDASTPLHLAAAAGHALLVELLLERKAEPSTPNTYNSTPVHEAAAHGHALVLRLLHAHATSCEPKLPPSLSRSSSISDPHITSITTTTTTTTATSAITPPSSGSYAGGLELSDSAEYDADADEREPWELLAHRARGGRTPLLLAAHRGHESCVRLLLELASDINCVDDAGRSALHLAAKHAHLAVVQLLLDRGADCNLPDADARTPLLLASNYPEVHEVLRRHRRLDEATCRQIVERRGINTRIWLNGRFVPMVYFACYNGFGALAMELTERGADLRALVTTPLPFWGSVLRVPASRAEQGHDAVLAWLAEATYTANNVFKLLLLGHGRAGKSTLAHLLRNGTSGIKGRRYLRPTVGVSVSKLRMRYQNMSFVLLDFAGQLEYLHTHHFFFSGRNAIVLVVVNSSLGPMEREKQLRCWLDYIGEVLPVPSEPTATPRSRRENAVQRRRRIHSHGHQLLTDLDGAQSSGAAARTRAPELAVQVVGTQCDLLRPTELSECRTQLSAVQSQWEHSHLILAPPILLSGVDPSAGDSFSKLTQQIGTMANVLLSNWRVQYVPATYVEAANILQRCSRAPQRSSSGSLADEAGSVAGEPPRLPAICRTDQLWSEPAFEALRAQVAPSTLADIAQYLHSIGALALSPSRSFVCLDLQLLSRLMAPFFCADRRQAQPHDHDVLLLFSQRQEHADATPSADDHTIHVHSERSRDRALVSRTAALRAIDSILECECAELQGELYPFAKPTADAALTALISWGLCVEIDPPRSQGSSGLLLFPSLRPICAVFRIPQDDLRATGISSELDIMQQLEQSPSVASGTDTTDADSSLACVPRALQSESRVSQIAFNQIQVQCRAFWHPRHSLYANGMIVALPCDSAPDASQQQPAVHADSDIFNVPPSLEYASDTERRSTSSVLSESQSRLYDAVGMVVLLDSGHLQVIVVATTSAHATKLLDGIVAASRQTVERLTRSLSFRELTRQDTISLWNKVAHRMPWAWASGDDFLHAERSAKWHRLTPDKLEALDIPSYQRIETPWVYLTDQHLAALGLPSGPHVTAPHRCKQLTHAELERLGLAKQLQPRELYYTELTDSETDAARRKEFNHVRQQWYEFVGADSSHDLEIDKVVALHNPALEQQFMEAFFDIQRRLQSADNDFVLLRDHDSSKAALQAFIERRLNDSLLCAIGSDQANLMLAWRGDLDHAHFAKAFYGFARLPELTAEQAQELRVGKPSQDYGWFGRGNYFTQYPSYGRAYSLKRARDSRRSSATIRRDDIGTDTDTDDDVHAALPLMLSFILMGRTYPVTEPCSLPFDQNLVGKPCVPGYDSHYALVSGPSSVMLPISSPTERPTADEIVVFNPCQILPRYIVYSSRRSLVPAPTGRNTVLWVAAAPMPDELQQWIAMHNLAEVREFQSRRQLEAWMRRYSQVLAPLVPHRIRIITQSVLDDATNERAGEILIQHFKSSAEWSRIPIALACSPIGAVLHCHQPENGVYLAPSAAITRDFASFEDLGSIAFSTAIAQYFREHHPYLWSPPDSPAPVPPRCTGANCVAEFGVLTWRGHVFRLLCRLATN